MINHGNKKSVFWVLFCIALTSTIPLLTHAIKETNDNDTPKCEKTDFECKYCDENELDCSSKGILDGMLTSPKFSLATFVPSHTAVINLSGNELTYLSVDYNEMWTNKSIRKLVFSHNEISVIYANTFKELKSLEVLDLSYNKIGFLQSDVFSYLENLQTLDISHNLLPRLDGFWFQGLKELIRLNLSFNRIVFDNHEIDNLNYPLDTLHQLKYLDMSNCSIDALPKAIFAGNVALEELRLSKNPFTEVPLSDIYFVRSTLEFLDLSETHIKVLRSRDFHGMKHLKTLLLNNMPSLTKIEPLAFNSLHRLNTLDCRNNKYLTGIDPFAFYNHFEDQEAIPIRNVFLSNNALTTLSSSLLPWKKIQTVKLDGNPWHCDCKFSWIVSKDVYNLSAIDYSYLICKSPEHVADLPIVHLSKDNFGCRLEYKNMVGLAFIVISCIAFLALIIMVIYIRICGNHPPKEKTRSNRSFNIAHLFHHESENIGNTASYTRMRNESFSSNS